VTEGPLPDLSEIYEAYHRKVLAYAAKLLGRDDAGDVAQEVFIKIGRSLETLTDRSKLASWIYAITLNTTRDLARKRAVSVAHLASDTPREDGAEETPLSELPDVRSRTPEQAASWNEMIACYLDYVSELPRHYYQVYVLSEFEDLSNEEIARRLSVSLGTVKIRLHRARAKLYDELRRNCRCYQNERGELMGEPRS
jgi:RNA polymerase sigma-70 factor (ECF subfamily)